jgi:hypothetical protein
VATAADGSGAASGGDPVKGTLSLLIGAHQVLVHPVCVVIAYRMLYRSWPAWWQLACIVVHDWGYIGCSDMDGPRGKRHPELGARIAGRLFGDEAHDWCLYHSRSRAKADGAEPSALCWADKLASALLPWWLYLPGAWLSGELSEYREQADAYWRKTAGADGVPWSGSHREWHTWMRQRLASKAWTHNLEQVA